MPEGDTIFRTAQTLHDALSGQQVMDVSTRVPQIRALGPRRLVGQRIASVESRGKHLLMRFAPSGLVLHSHMRMSGSWHLYRVGERWRKPEHLARVVVEGPQHVAVCFSAPVCQLLTPAQLEQLPSIASLGPDPLDGDADLVEARRRLDAVADATIGEALLDQRVLAGVGNVFKSEILFIHGVDPWTRVGDMSAQLRDQLLTTAAELLQRNVRDDVIGRTTTEPGTASGRLYVYGRARRPCTRCGTPISRARQGEHGRSTYWCRRCQGEGPVDGRRRR